MSSVSNETSSINHIMYFLAATTMVKLLLILLACGRDQWLYQQVRRVDAS